MAGRQHLLKAAPLALVALGLLLAWMTPFPAAARPQRVVVGSEELGFDGSVSPTSLPRQRPAPIALTLSGVLPDGSASSPSLSWMVIEFDRQGLIDTEGLPACGLKQLEGASWEVAKRSCRKSIVGSGSAKVDAAIPGQITESGAPALLTIFFGGARNGVTTLYLQGALAGPIPTTVVAKEKIRPIDNGPYGYEAVTKIPPIEHESVRLLSFKLRIHRSFKLEAAKHSFVSVRCRTGTVAANATSFLLQNGETFSIGSRAVKPLTCVRPEQVASTIGPR